MAEIHITRVEAPVSSPDEQRALLIKQNREIFPPLDRDFAAALGMVCSEWAKVEAQLASAIGFLLGLEGRGLDAVTRSLQMHARMELAAGLVQLVGDETLSTEWKAIEVLVQTIKPKRNEAVHSIWEADGADGRIWGQPVRGDIRIVRGTVTTADLTALCDDMTYLTIRIAKLPQAIIRAGAPAKLKEHNPPGFNPVHHILTHKLAAQPPAPPPSRPDKP